MTNEEFAKQDPTFITACRLAEIKPTKRQASKWRNGKGLAKKMHGAAVTFLKSTGSQKT